MVITSFKTELEAYRRRNSCSSTGRRELRDRAAAQRLPALHAMNSIIIAGGSTLLALIIAIPAAWAMAFAPTKRTKDMLLWMLSTKMMPAVGVLVPIYLIFRDLLGLLDTRFGLIVVLPRQSADRDLDALHLLQGDPEGHPRGRAHGRRHHLARDRLCADADGGSRHRLDACCSTSSWPGTRRSGR